MAAFYAESIEILTHTFVSGEASKRYDADIANRLAHALGYQHVELVEPAPDIAVRELLNQTQPLVREVPHVLSQLTWYSTQQPQSLTVSGVGGEVARQHIGLVPRGIGRSATARTELGHAAHPRDVEGFDRWWDDRFPDGNQQGLPAPTLHYWEQRLAIWGSQFVAEKDLFTDEVSGFSSGRLQQSLVSFPHHQRSTLTSATFWGLIEELAPDLARMGKPPPPPIVKRAYSATPIPALLRSCRPGWGRR